MLTYNIDMVVYIELVLFNNIAINALILYIANLIIGCRQVWWRILLASSIGAGYALASPMMGFSWEIVLKVLLSLLICVIMTSIADFKGYIRYIVIFYTVTFLLGGSIMAFSYMSVTIKQALFSTVSVATGVVALSALIMLIAIKYIIRRRNTARSKAFVVDVVIKSSKATVTLKGLLDSGNRLYYKGIYPVIAINAGVIELSKQVGSMRVVTANGSENQLLYHLDYCRVGGKRFNSIYAIVSRCDTECDVILHSSML